MNKMKEAHTFSRGFLLKLLLTFVLMGSLMALSYIFITQYFSAEYAKEASQKLNKSVAQHLIDEKFTNASPFLENGDVNKPLFGDLMHDMMAVNRSIEVYLLNETGEILYSVVLDHSNPNEPATSVSLSPIKKFIEKDGEEFILGDDPRNPGQPNIFSAAAYEVDGHSGYVYIILAGREAAAVTNALSSSYFLSLGAGAALITTVFVFLLGLALLWYLTRNIRGLVKIVNRFREGDMDARVPNADKSDLSILASTFNDMADTLKAHVEEMQSVDTLRRELIANVSHDLRTPLAVLHGYVETLEIKYENLSDDEKKHYLDIIKGSADKLSHLVAQLFEYSKLEAQQVKPQKEPFSLTDLSLDLLAHYQVIADKKNITLKLDSPNVTPMVFADIKLVERAIQNLMDNAIKFTPENGNVTIGLEVRADSVLLKVMDSGPGIPQEEQKHIFERFTQADTQKKARGAGLGLAIVKKIIELHNSQVEIISQPNHGASFQFALPSYAG
ncbi:MAG: ATP-binding protein [Schleiferiaceae bacterium]